jgi:hypothetical protein
VLINVFLASYWSAGFSTFLQALALASHWLEDFADGTPVGKLTNKTPITPSETPAASQSAFVIYQLYSTCD